MNLVRNPEHVKWAVRLAKARGFNLYWQYKGDRCQHGRTSQCWLCMDEHLEILTTEPPYSIKEKQCPIKDK